MLWIETKTPEDAKRIRDRLWEVEIREGDDHTELRVRGEGLSENGEFWIDVIARLKDHPSERLALAVRHLPLPAASPRPQPPCGRLSARSENKRRIANPNSGSSISWPPS
jgi:hypothetical protein